MGKDHNRSSACRYNGRNFQRQTDPSYPRNKVSDNAVLLFDAFHASLQMYLSIFLCFLSLCFEVFQNPTNTYSPKCSANPIMVTPIRGLYMTFFEIFFSNFRSHIKDSKWGRNCIFINSKSCNRSPQEIPFQFANGKLPHSCFRAFQALFPIFFILFLTVVTVEHSNKR